MPSDRPRIGLAIIARDEQLNLPTLLESIEGAFDRVVLLDTGSTDATVEVFKAWAQSQTMLTYSVGSFEWCDDFSAARAAADMLLLYGSADEPGEKVAPLVDWTSWADCDDTIEHPEALRQIAADAPPNVGAFIFSYAYAHDEHGRVICHLRRERLVRARAGRWTGRVHEGQVFDGGHQVRFIADGVCRWVHHKRVHDPGVATASNQRNVAILRAWMADEPDTPRVVSYLGRELAAQGKLDEGVELFRRYVALDPQWGDERAQVHRLLSLCLLMRDDIDGAQRSALDAMAFCPTWPDSYITMAECALAQGHPDRALEWSRQAIERGIPETLMIINPLDYQFGPRRLRALALGALGRFEEAIGAAEEAFPYSADDQLLRNSWMTWKVHVKRESTATTFVSCAQLLVAQDEQLKALRLLEECVPHFATDHERVVGLRSWLRERISWAFSDGDFAEHYDKGGSKPEDFIPDEHVDAICEALPRVAFLIDGLFEQGAGSDDDEPSPFVLGWASMGSVHHNHDAIGVYANCPACGTLIERVVTPDQFRDGYAVKNGDEITTKPYELIRRLDDGNYLVVAA